MYLSIYTKKYSIWNLELSLSKSLRTLCSWKRDYWKYTKCMCIYILVLTSPLLMWRVDGFPKYFLIWETDKSKYYHLSVSHPNSFHDYNSDRWQQAKPAHIFSFSFMSIFSKWSILQSNHGCILFISNRLSYKRSIWITFFSIKFAVFILCRICDTVPVKKWNIYFKKPCKTYQK